ncbi:hypothetical protein DFA_08893 [Cavenderia fasciculata]|uniref:Uncharacterized protein n=1 Tax=Cavenderia fasciculata TaxID=261658 RepID=F4Q4U6_CACFS|nr:uncharacterized protein DFA_08893 [Cavenderia fasciculata]EGG17892.1 hypothetical protein DFA_08893 [Cavenderia fasciculata]|eukprot:XP_004356376.1 hypothetical protein DFA_08893 [Cavenderia fasciculata]
MALSYIINILINIDRDQYTNKATLFLILCLGIINGQSSPMMVFNQQPDQSIEYLEIDIYSGQVLKNQSIANNDGVKILKYMQAADPFVSFFTTNGTNFQIYTFNVNTNEFINTFNSTTNFLNEPTFSDQPFGYFWKQTSTAYFPGPTQLNRTAQFNSVPTSAFDGIDYFYVHFSIGDITGISEFSLLGSTSKQVILSTPGRQIQGTQQLFMLYGQLYLCVLENGVGVTVSILNLDNGEVDIIYKDLNPEYQNTFQPFVLNKINGSISILVKTSDNKILSTFIFFNQSTKQFTIDNVIPEKSNIIIPVVIISNRDNALLVSGQVNYTYTASPRVTSTGSTALFINMRVFSPADCPMNQYPTGYPEKVVSFLPGQCYNYPNHTSVAMYIVNTILFSYNEYASWNCLNPLVTTFQFSYNPVS